MVSQNKIQRLLTLILFTFSALSYASITPKPSKHSVIIVGAGAAGLAAATTLRAHDIDVLILEATDRYGGRVKENTQFADFPIDLGAEWIHEDQSILDYLSPNKQHYSKPLIRYSPMNVYYLDGNEYRKVDKYTLEEAYQDEPESKFKDSTWYQYLDTNFASKVKPYIKFQSEVVSINYSTKPIIVTTRNGTQYSADKVLIAVPIGVLKEDKITFIPRLPKKKNKAIHNSEFLKGFKLVLKFKKKFYPDMIVVETKHGEETFYDMAYQKGSQMAVLGLLATGTSAEHYYQYGSKQDIVRAVITKLDNLLEHQASRYFSGQYIFEDWGNATYTLGTWASPYINRRQLMALTSPVQDKLYFAGDAFAPNDDRATVHGAILSGYRAAEEIMQTN
ncbi:FAD-dependent oxidoreductase [Vibrio sp. S4M6]|uniref:flavin monoamine oxidase family protein n=1 Tax=Vibrio sinus TaxID=2946865 RepID=UPI00202A54C0|nr:FAD-dependent oxidoreductase [Vibrio sinus]MCL9780728.1 FAD-dependent oxidoreductase [Vibrio sinus]